jgi:hypothetical protein
MTQIEGDAVAAGYSIPGEISEAKQGSRYNV